MFLNEMKMKMNASVAKGIKEEMVLDETEDL